MLDANERESRSITLRGPSSRQHRTAAAHPPRSRRFAHPPRMGGTGVDAWWPLTSYCHVADVNIS